MQSVPSNNLKTLNNYPEFNSTAGINAIQQFILSPANARIYPASVNTNRKKQRYRDKFDGRSGFVVQNARLYYRKPNAGINLEVVYPNEREQKIRGIYNDITKGLGTGLAQFYGQVAMHFLNIKKTDTDAFLRKQGDYVVGRLTKKQINAPIIAKKSNERWGIDLIDMTAYTENNENAPKWILTCVDYYSSKVFARHMPNKTLATIVIKMQDICQSNNTFPRMLQADGEFHAGNPNQANVLKQWCERNSIEFIKTLSYTPTSNGKIERMNREIRKKIRAGFVRNNNNVWATFLDDYIENINNQQTLKTKMTPNQLWVPGYNAAGPGLANPYIEIDDATGRISTNIPRRSDNMTQQQINNIAEAKQYKKAQDMLAQSEKKYGKPKEFSIGDKVRISLYTISNKMREAKKERRINKLAIHWTPEIYRVESKNENREGVRRTSYTVRNEETGIVFMNDQSRAGVRPTPKLFFANELIAQDQIKIVNARPQYSGFNQTSVAPTTTNRALQLNRINRLVV